MKRKINGTDLAFEQQEGNGVPLVLLHGFAMNRSIWQEMISNYLPSVPIISLDTRGHGESESTQGEYSMELLAADLEGLLRSLNIGKAIVCGHSMGGYIALAFAEQFPDRLAGLGLITTNAAADDDSKRAARYAQIEDIRKRGSIAVADSLAPRLSHNPTIIAWAHDMIIDTNPLGLIGSLSGMAERSDRSALLPGIEVPTVVIAGESDQITDYDASKTMAKALPQGTFIGLNNSGHLPMMETPKTLAGALLSLSKQVQD